MELPQEFVRKIKNIEITKTKLGDLLLTDKSSDNFLLQEYIGSDISVKNGIILGSEKKSYEYEGKETIYYLLTLKDSIVNEKKVLELKIRLSEALYTKNSLKIGDKIDVKGKLIKDKFQGLIVKFIRNVITKKVGKSEKSKIETPTKEKQWTIKSSSDSNKSYIITLKADGTWKCTCPQFTFRKKLCKHISECKINLPKS